MSLGSILKRWFGSGDAPLRRSMVSGIEQASQGPLQSRPQGRSQSESDDEIENPFEDGELTAGWLRGTARVVELTRTGELIGPAELVRLTLSVTIPGRPSYEQAGHRHLISPAALPSWEPGSVVSVSVDPDDPARLVLG